MSSFVEDNDISCFLVCETLLKNSHTERTIKELTPPGFKLFANNRTKKVKNRRKKMVVKRGGGVGVFFKETNNTQVLEGPDIGSFEYVIVNSQMDFGTCNFVSLYRPKELSIISFLSDFEELLTFLISNPVDFMIGGDFNLTKADDLLQFREVIETFDLKQHVDFPSRCTTNNILDYFITSNDFQHVESVRCSEKLSDHFSILINLVFPEKQILEIPKVTNYHPFKKIVVTDFMDDLKASVLICSPKNTAVELYNQYHRTLSTLIDKHAPNRTKICCSRPPNPWITEDVREAKRLKRQLERRWRRTKSAIDRIRFNTQVCRCNKTMARAKNNWYTNMIEDNKHDPKKLWNSVNSILHRKPVSVLPDHSSVPTLAKSDKISKVMANFTPVNNSYTDAPNSRPPGYDKFVSVSESDVRKIIASSPDKQCELDPCPTWLVKSCIDILVKPITSIVNYSLEEGVFPESFKHAHVTPLIKKPTLPRNELKNYRPVSGLNYISKILEKVIASHVKSH